jgi:hypothetical protein
LRKEFAVMAKGGKAEKWAARSERLSAALRENLKRRKQQAKGREHGRERAGDHAGHEETPAPETGLEAQNPDFRRNRGGE